ncbi:unnamed protein product [Sphagnum jensenii]|uniref:Diacylglycerol kinase n=1 Tax=Sphagnum jensenii TaxID=128206 RepID=A0ABP1BIE5_9BRYO
MAAETAGGAFHEGAGDGGEPGKQQQVLLVPEEIRRNGVHADAGIGDLGESLDFSHPLREGLEEEEEEKHSQGGGGGGGGGAAAAAADDDDDDDDAKANGDHHLAAQDGAALEVSEDRVASVVDEVREEEEEGEDSSVQAAPQGSEAVEEEEEAAVPPKLAVQTSPPEGLLQSHDEVPQPQHQQASEGELLPNASEGAETVSDSKTAAEEYPQRDLALSSTGAARSVEFPQTSKEDEEEKISSSSSKPQAGTVQAVESATRLEKVDPEEEEEAAAVELSSSSAALPLPNAGRTATKRGKKGPSDEELKKMVVIPEYLAKDFAKAIQSAGAAYPDGPPFGDKIEAPPCPLLVFVNSKSGSRLGPALTQHLAELISPNQVYDLASTKPTDVIRYGIGCLDKLATSGDECAGLIRSNLRIIVAGGDGTVGWVLSCLDELQISSPSGNVPPVSIIPLGTGNDLSRSFGWGGGFSSASKGAVRKLLLKTLSASVVPVDTWQVVVKPTAAIASTDIQFPHALHPQHHVPLPRTVWTKDQKDENDPCFEGLFWNYFSIGMDAQVAYGFHHLRDEKPWLARGRVTNQMIYSGYGCTQGWFCTTCSAAPRARGIHNIVRLQIKRPGSSKHDWEEIEIPHNIRAIVVLNLQSYAGGRKPWGHPSENTMKKEGFVEAKSDDGLLEIVGFRDGWHTAFVMISVLTAVRLCQAEAVRLELRGNRPRGYMQMDGEPWKQPLGRVDEPATLVEINKLSTPTILLKR